MKKAIIFCIILTLCFSLFSCESKTASQSTESGVTSCPPLPSDSSDGVSDSDGESTEDKVYVFDVCTDSFDEDALIFSGAVSYRVPCSDILSTFLLSDADAEFMLNILNNGSWKNDVCKCAPDRIINVGVKKLEYCSGCGAINFIKEGKSLTFTKGSRQAICLESILNINEG